MTIGIDASKIAKKIKTGTETYSAELIKALAKIDQRNDYILYSPSPISDKLPDLPKNFQIKVLPFTKGWTQIRLSLEMLFNKPDILFMPAHTLPMRFPKKTVCTIHDLGFIHFPELYSAKELRYQSWALRHALKHAYHIIAVSEFTKKDLAEQFHLDPQKITVVYEAYDKEKFQPSSTKKSDPPTILFIGRLEEKKNIINMIRAFGRLRENPAIKHRFVLAGKPGFGYDKIQSEIKKLPADVARDIKLPGYVSEDVYLELLKNADILFFSTMFEGFGLPVLEAMACGIPVVASNRTSLPEIVSDAGLLVDPANAEDMAAALAKIILDENLKKDLIVKGLARAQQFSWQKTAQETLKVFESLK